MINHCRIHFGMRESLGALIHSHSTVFLPQKCLTTMNSYVAQMIQKGSVVLFTLLLCHKYLSDQKISVNTRLVPWYHFPSTFRYPLLLTLKCQSPTALKLDGAIRRSCSILRNLGVELPLPYLKSFP